MADVPTAEVSPMSDDKLYIRIHGYSAAQTTVDREKWEKMSREERRDLAETCLMRNGEPTAIASVIAEEDGELHSEEEW